MAKTNIIDLVKKHCKLYKGGDTNPYNFTGQTGKKWQEAYLRFHVWEAEYSVVQKFTWWREMWESQHKAEAASISKADKAEEVYKLAVLDKLKKMQRPDIDFIKMYFEL